MFSEYLKPVRSFHVETNLDEKEIDTHGLMAYMKVSENPAYVEGPEGEFYHGSYIVYPGDVFRFCGKIRVKNVEEPNSVLRIMLFEKE